MTHVSIREARPHDAYDISQVKLAGWQQTFRGLMTDAFLDTLDSKKDCDTTFKLLEEPPNGFHAYVATTPDNKVVGFTMGGAHRTGGFPFDGELWTIFVLGHFHGQRVGARLVEATSQRLAHDGFHHMAIWCLKDNPSVKFYERLGGQYFHTRTRHLGGADLEENGYGWDVIPLR